MSATKDTVVWTKLVITGCPGMECVIHTTADGRTVDDEGEPLPLDERTRVCGGPGAWVLGMAFLCQAHAAEVAEMMGDSLQAIDDAWRAQL